MELNPITAVGLWFYSLTSSRYLYLLRNDQKNPGCWGLPGGKQISNENLWCTLQRECQEELGFMPEFTQLIPLEKFTSTDQRFEYHTFWASVPNEFIPILNDEHLGYAWVTAGNWPKPMHPGLWNLVNIEELRKKIVFMENDLVIKNISVNR